MRDFVITPTATAAHASAAASHTLQVPIAKAQHGVTTCKAMQDGLAGDADNCMARAKDANDDVGQQLHKSAALC